MNTSQRSFASHAQDNAAAVSEAATNMTENNYRDLLDKFADQKKQKRTAETEK